MASMTRVWMVVALATVALSGVAAGQSVDLVLNHQEVGSSDGLYGPGEIFEYRILVSPTSGEITGAVVDLPIPEILSVVAGTATTTQGTILEGSSAGDTHLTVDLGDVSASLGALATVQVQIPTPLDTCLATIVAQATLEADGIGTVFSRDFDGGPTELPVTIGASTSQTLLVSDADGGGLASPGETLSYTAFVSFSGDGVVDSLRWTLALLTNAEIVAGSVSVVPASASVLVGNGPGDTTVVVEAPGPLTAVNLRIDFEATVELISDPSDVEVRAVGRVTRGCLVPNVREVAIPLAAGAGDVRVLKDDGGQVGEPGEVVTYTVTAENLAASPAVGVQLEDVLPAFTTFEPGLSDPRWTCSGGTCRLVVGMLAVGESQSYAVAVRVDESLPVGVEEIVNVARISVSGQDADPDNNLAMEITPLTGVGPDVAIAKDDGGAAADAGGLVTYTVTVSNLGNQDATGVVVTDTLPGSTSFEPEGSDAGWSCSTASCSLAVGDLAASAGSSFDLVVRVDPTLPAGIDELVNTAVVAADEDLDGSNNTAQEITPLGAGVGPDVAIAKSDAGAAADAGGLVTYTVTVSNLGNQDATGVSVTDTLPGSTSFEPAGSDAGWSCSTTSCSLAVGDLAAGDIVSFDLVVRVDAALPAGLEELVNTGVVAADEDLDGSNNTAQEITPLDAGVGPDVTITKDDAGAVADAGGLVTYTVTVSNLGNQDATGVSVTDTLPGSTSFEPASSDGAWSCSAGSCSLAVGDLAAGDVVSFDLVVRVDSTLPAGLDELVNTAVVAADEDLDGSNNSAQEITPLGVGVSADVAITKDDGGAVADAGGLVTYTVTVSNLGNQDATGASVTDTLPGSTSFEPAGSDPAWSCSTTSCSLAVGDLAAGDIVSFDLVVRVAGSLPAGLEELVNTAVVTADEDLDGSNNSAQEVTPLAAGVGPDVAITKSDAGAVADAGGLVTYTVTVTNVGNQDATGASVTDTLPGSTSFEPASSDGAWSCSGSSCTLAVGDLAAGAGSSFDLVVRVDATLPAGLEELVNTVVVAADEDLDPSNDVDQEITPLATGVGADVAIAKDDGGAVADASGVVIYSVTVSNVGSQDATGVSVTDALPGSMSFEPAGSDGAWSCSGGSCSLAVGDLAATDVVSFDLVVRVDATLPAGLDELVNTAVVTADEDLDGSNNTAQEITPLGAGVGADVAIAKDDGGASADAGGLVTYTVTVTNEGNQDATGVSVADTLPEATSFEASGSDGGWTCGSTSCSLTVGDLAAGDVVSFDLVVRVDSTLPAGLEKLLNVAAVVADQDLDPSNNSDSEVTPLGEGVGPDLVVTKGDGGAVAKPGSLVVYSVLVRNAGVAAAAGVVLTDTLSEWTSAVPASSSPEWECAGLECWVEIGDLAAGEEVSYELAAAVVESVPSDVDELVNVASVSESLGADLDLSNNADEELTPLVLEDGVAELYATKVDSFTSPEPYGVPGPVIVYRTEIFNLGTAAAVGVRFSPHGDPATALLPESVIVDGGGIVLIGTAGGVVVEWAEIGAGEMATVLFSVEIVHPIAPGLRQVACQGFLTGSNFPETPTDDPDTAEPLDPTVTDLEGVIDPELIDAPTLSGLGLAGLSLLLAAVGLATMRRRRAVVVRVGLFAALLLPPLRASEAGCGNNSPAVPVPECRSANGAEVDCSTPGAVRLWPGDLRPGLPGKTLPEERDSTQWTSTTIPGAESGHELFQSLAVLEGYLYVAYNAGVQVWDIRGPRAEDPELLAAADGWRGDFFSFPGIGENDFYVDDVGVAEGLTGARLVGVSGKDTTGFTWWLHDAATGQLAQLYQDFGNDSRQVRVVSRNGNVFAFTAGPVGIDVYHGTLAELLYTGCPPEVPPELCVCLDDHGSACPGIYLGTLPDELPGLYLDVLFRDQRLFVAVSGGTGIPVRIWEVDPMVPPRAELRFSGLASGTQGLAFFERSGHPYLAAVVRQADTPPRWYLRIYDVLGCLEGCSSLGGELFSVEVSSGAVQRFLTYSESGGRPFLYFGLDLIGLEGEGEELLLDLGEFPAMVRELTSGGGSYFDTCSALPVDYWGDYYPQNGNGLRNIRPRVGQFAGKYFYRAAWGALDVHVLEEELPLFADSFESGDVSGWNGPEE